MKAILDGQFGGRPINEQNLSEWKARGHREWLVRQEALAQARELAADAQELCDATDGKLTDHLQGAGCPLCRRTRGLGWGGDERISPQIACLARFVPGHRRIAPWRP